MEFAWILTLLALCGVGAGVLWGHAVRFSDHLSAAGGGLLFGISLFWLVPEVSETAGPFRALFVAIGVAGVLTLIDRALMHKEHSTNQHSAHHRFLWPILLATAMHSFFDGWSIRLLSTQPLTHATVTVGLALHKIPEGLALGWITRRALPSALRAFLAGTAAETLTLAGAFAEPNLNASGSERYGTWWAAGVLSVIAGGFLFLGLHAILPAWRRRKVMATFLATLLLLLALTFVRSGNI